ncbi:MAG: hypothetical protein LUC91_01285 [Prevotella sp.]|nr:hypothetical protein [Prevotella sp.]
MGIKNGNNDNSPTWSASALCWKHWRLYLVVSLSCVLLAVIVTVSIPKTYAAFVKVADEPKEIDILVGLNSYKAWIKQGIAKTYGKQGMSSPDLYSFFLRSNTFMEQISAIYIDNYNTDYYHYLLKYHKQAWWISICKKISLLWSKPNEKDEIYSIIKNNVRSNYSSRNSTITIRVVDNNPVVAALVADSVRNRLQLKIIENRRGVSQANLINATKTKDQLEKKYCDAQDEYNAYRDSHFDESLPNVKIALDGLRKERDRAFNDYSEAYEQYERAEILNHKEVNSFSVLKNVTVPIKSFEPIFIVYVLVFLFLGLVFTTWWILFERLIKCKK